MRSDKRRADGGKRRPSGPAASREPPRWLRWPRWLFFASGWVAAVLVGVLELPAKIVSFSQSYTPAKESMLAAALQYERYAGRFSSDPDAWVGRNLVGDGTHPSDKGDIQLDLEYIGRGQYRGELRSGFMAKHSIAPWSRVMVDGKVGLTGVFEGTVWDIVNGGRAPYAAFRLSPDDKSVGSLRLAPVSPNDVFPGDVVLWPTEHKMSTGERGHRFDELLHQVVRQPAPTPNPTNVPTQ